MVVDRPTPFERLSFLPSFLLFLFLSLSFSRVFCEYYYVRRLQTMVWCDFDPFFFFFGFFPKSKLNAQMPNAKLIRKTKKKEGRKKKRGSIYSYNSFVRSRTLLPHRDRHAVRSAPTVRDYRRRHHCHWWHPIRRARFTHG